MDVVEVYRKAVGLVFGPLQVGQVESDGIAQVDGDVLGVDMGAYHRSVDVDMVAFANDPLLPCQGLPDMGLAGEGAGTHFVANFGLEFAGPDRDRLVGLTQRNRHIVEQLHLLATDIDQLVVLGMQRPDLVEAVDGQLVQSDDVVTLRILGLALHSTEVTDIVVDVLAVDDFTLQVIPADHLTVDVERGVDLAVLPVLAVLVVQGPKAQLSLTMGGLFHVENGDAVGVFAGIVLVVDRFFDFVPAVNRRMGIELSADDDIFTVGGDVDTVGRLGLGDQEERIVLDRHVDGNDPVAVDDLDVFVILGQFGQFFPVVDMEEVGIVPAHPRFHRRQALLDTAGIHLGVETVGEAPSVARLFSGIGEVLHIGGHLDGEGFFRNDPPDLGVEFPDRHPAAIGLFVLFDGVVVVIEGSTVLACFENVFAVGGEESPAVVRLEDGVDHDLLGDEVLQVDDRQTGVGFVVDDQPLSVVLSVGLGEGGVVGISPGDLLAADLALREDRFGIVVIAPSLPRFRGEDTDVLEDPHRGNPVDHDLPRLSAGTEDNVLVPSATGGVGLGGRQQILLGQTALLHDLVELRLGRGHGDADQGADGYHR